MPPRKSNVSVASNAPDEGADDTPARSSKDGVNDLSLPKSMIARLAKGVLPANTQIHKDALLALHKSATVFVSYIASNSSENVQASGKKTVMPPDVMAALKDAEFENFLPRLDAELKKYNDVQCDKRNTYRRKVKEEKAAAAATGEHDEPSATEENDAQAANGVANGHDALGDDERPVKKLKGGSGEAVAPGTYPADHEMFDDGPSVDHDDPDEHDPDDDDEEEDEADDAVNEDGEQEDAGDPVEDLNGRGEMQDEALDEPDSD
ncbi:hypothetical protein BAUCODRAFT_61755 [Baudoinia panamericana UAMH 10762]|uniref:DNA polymerase epsilon subunit D n=1 Tax=Baudoinia panamericana (strain UAMH 10762) TaxID=717646 RepID=M2NAD4_BAUPA|nr:uncharacterized protein BAUCODRAFT_61755 [Baudoinia panamericana UAMH 10762]EMD01184.1 hypothetical protein BAUCODRAFT_61755 [Baudoinia panamericana UAMH 10762]